MSGLLLGMVLSVCICWFHSMVTLPPRVISTDLRTCSYQCYASNCTPVSLHMLKCIIIIIIITKLVFVSPTLTILICEGVQTNGGRRKSAGEHKQICYSLCCEGIRFVIFNIGTGGRWL
jgi:hypothetical protein